MGGGWWMDGNESKRNRQIIENESKKVDGGWMVDEGCMECGWWMDGNESKTDHESKGVDGGIKDGWMDGWKETNQKWFEQE